jgi:hypothetical protein
MLRELPDLDTNVIDDSLDVWMPVIEPHDGGLPEPPHIHSISHGSLIRAGARGR